MKRTAFTFALFTVAILCGGTERQMPLSNAPTPVADTPKQVAVISAPTAGPISLSQAAIIAEHYLVEQGMSADFCITEVSLERAKDGTPQRYVAWLNSRIPSNDPPRPRPYTRPYTTFSITIDGHISTRVLQIRAM